MVSERQLSYAKGELDPALHARPDLIPFITGLATCRNFTVERQGGVRNRPGTQFIAELHTSAQAGRLIPFIFNDTNSFALVFNALKMRVIKNGAQISDISATITAITQANPGAVTTAAPHGYATGDEVAINDVVGMTELNNRNFKIVVTGASTFDLQDMDAVNFDTSGLTAYVSGGIAARVFEITTPYTAAQLPNLRFAQSADVMTLVHPEHFPRQLIRTSDTVWSLSLIRFEPGSQRASTIGIAGFAAGALDISYLVTAIRKTSGEESGAGFRSTFNITAITNASPAVVTTSAPHGIINGREVIIEDVTGMHEVNDRTFIVRNVTATTLELENEDSTLYTAFSLVGIPIIGERGVRTPAAALPTSGVPITITWTLLPNASLFTFNVYRKDADDGVFGLVGEASGTSFVDTGFTPDILSQPPIERVPFFKAGLFPGAVGTFQQRTCMGGSDLEPETIRCSQSARRTNFYTSVPGVDSDVVTFSTLGQKVSRVKHMIDLGALIVFTSNIEYQIQGDDSNRLTPLAASPFAQSYFGAADRRPLVTANNAFFIQNRGSIVRDLLFEIQSQQYQGNDLTVASAHLFDRFTIDDWDIQRVPTPIVWSVRSDGNLNALTSLREHQINAWTRHDMENADFENVIVLPEGNEERPYFIVERTISGRVARYVERMHSREVDPLLVENSIFMDSSLTFDGRAQGVVTGFTMAISGGLPWGPFDPPLTLTCSGAFFALEDVGNEIVVRVGGVAIRFRITGFTSATVVTGQPDAPVPVSHQGVASGDWDEAVDEVTGIHHLEGQTVSVFADGLVLANPNNATIALILTVTNGRITLSEPHALIHVGRPYTSDMETLDIDTVQGETLADKKTAINTVVTFIEETRGLFVGPKFPPTDLVEPVNVGGEMYPIKVDQTEDAYDNPPPLITGKEKTRIKSEWRDGRVAVRQTDPIPATILSMVRAGYIPYRR